MDSQQMLTSILHTVQMGQSGIRCVQSKAVRPALRKELQRQLTEYDTMETEAKAIATQNHWKISDVPKSVTAMSQFMSNFKLLGGDRDSKIADMLIQGNTKGMILGLKNLRQGNRVSDPIRQMALRLIQRERISIENSESFL